MPKPPVNAPIKKENLSLAVHRLNLFYDDQSMWFPTWSKKERIDLFDVSIPINATYYKRCIGTRSKPLMILSKRSLARVYHCLATANSRFEMLAKELAEEEQRLFDEAMNPRPDGGE
jgi:hypothetical protein